MIVVYLAVSSPADQPSKARLLNPWGTWSHVFSLYFVSAEAYGKDASSEFYRRNYLFL